MPDRTGNCRTFPPLVGLPRQAGCGPAGLGSRMSVEDSDLKLVERVQRGERAAFDLLVLRYQHKVLKLIMRYVHDATEAEDIAQEAFVKAFSVAVVSRR